MAIQELSGYRKGTRPELTESEREYLDRELKKIEDSIRSIVAAIKQIRGN